MDPKLIGALSVIQTVGEFLKEAAKAEALTPEITAIAQECTLSALKQMRDTFIGEPSKLVIPTIGHMVKA